MTCLILLFPIKTYYSPLTLGHCFATFSAKQCYGGLLLCLCQLQTERVARFLLMAEFAYNNAKNASSGHTPFELKCGYLLWMSYKKDVKPHFKSKKNLHYAQELQKQAHNKGVKPRSYVSNNKVWLNSRYIKIKQKQKLETKFFRPFRVLYPVKK